MTKKDKYRRLFSNKMKNKQYLHHNGNVTEFDTYEYITDSIYARLEVLFESGEFDEYIKGVLNDE